MDPFGYVAGITSVVLALGIAHILRGAGRLMQARGRVRLYWVHLLWALNLFLFLLLNAWILYRWSNRESWTFFLLLFVLLSPILGYILAVLLFPDPLPEGTDLQTHYYRNSRWFFGLAALLPLIDAIDTALKGPEHLAAQGSIYPVTIVLLFALNVTASVTRNPRFHAFFAVFFLVYILAFIAINLRVLA
jgi:hypothetical protein